MKKETKHIALIILGISAALVGLISLQIYLLVDSYEQKEQAFDRNVLNALNTVSQQIEKDEAASKIFNVAMQFPSLPPDGKKKKFKRFTPKDSSLHKGAATGSFTWIISDTVQGVQGKQMRVEMFHSSGIDTMTSVVARVKPERKKTNEQQTFGYSYSTDENSVSMRANVGNSTMVLLQDTTKKRRGEIVARVVDKLFLVETLPLEQRLDPRKLDSLIKLSLSNVGITMDYSFRVTVGDGDFVKLTKDSIQKKELSVRGMIAPGTTNANYDSNQSFTVTQTTGYHIDSVLVDGINVGEVASYDFTNVTATQTPFKTQLFPNDVISQKYILALFLPEKSSFVLKEMTMLMVMSLLFISIVIACFIYIIRIIVLQKRFAVSTIDFINNMTHEFKTPISTIALASEAIAKPDVLKSKPKILKYNSLIHDENNRMKHQVDKILQMAVLEEGEFELKISDVDMHSVIQQAVKNISLQVEQRNGKVVSNLNAKLCVVRGDAVHLVNIIHNVLDNAVKYSPAIPTINIATENAGSMVSVRISDNGIGIRKEDAERVFDKYYRVSTGNTHDVKGFGLGLSYVKLIVEAHHGTVSIDSRIGEGTTVEITLPCSS